MERRRVSEEVNTSRSVNCETHERASSRLRREKTKEGQLECLKEKTGREHAKLTLEGLVPAGEQEHLERERRTRESQLERV